MEENYFNSDSWVSFVFNEETRTWKIKNGKGLTGEEIISEERGKELLLEYCLRFPSLNLVKNDGEIILNNNYHFIGKVEYTNKKELSLIQFLYDILFVLQKKRNDIQIIPGFHQQKNGVKMTILKNTIVLNNVFGKNNLLSEKEQEFFLKTFQEFGDYHNLLHSNFGRILKNTNQIKE